MHGVTVDMGPCPTALLVTRLDWGQSNTQMWFLILESWRETGVCNFMRVLTRGLGQALWEVTEPGRASPE